MIHPAKMYVTEKRPPMQQQIKKPCTTENRQGQQYDGEISSPNSHSRFAYFAKARQNGQPPPVWAILHRFDGLLVSYKKMPMLARLNPSISRGLENTKTATLARVAVIPALTQSLCTSGGWLAQLTSQDFGCGLVRLIISHFAFSFTYILYKKRR